MTQGSLAFDKERVTLKNANRKLDFKLCYSSINTRQLREVFPGCQSEEQFRAKVWTRWNTIHAKWLNNLDGVDGMSRDEIKRERGIVSGERILYKRLCKKLRERVFYNEVCKQLKKGGRQSLRFEYDPLSDEGALAICNNLEKMQGRKELLMKKQYWWIFWK